MSITKSMSKAERRRAFNKAIKQALEDKTGVLTTPERRILELLTLAVSNITDILNSQPSDYQQWFLPQIEQQIYPLLDNFALTASTVFKEAATTAAAAGAAMFDKPLLASGVQLWGVTPLVVPEQIAAIAEFGGTRLVDISTKAKLMINSELGLTMIGTQTSHEAVSKIASYLQDTPRHRIKTIVKTEMSRAYAISGEKRFSQLATSFPDLQKEWRKSGKFHARESHTAAHKQRVPYKSFFIIGGIKMRHPHDPSAPAKEVINCGCTMVPYIPNWADFKEFIN
jgi:hypothetical protein